MKFCLCVYANHCIRYRNGSVLCCEHIFSSRFLWASSLFFMIHRFFLSFEHLLLSFILAISLTISEEPNH